MRELGRKRIGVVLIRLVLAALRRVLWQHRISPNSRLPVRVRDILETVFYALSAAA